MRGGLLTGLVALVVGAAPGLFAQRGMGNGVQLHGTPASVTSPGIDGRLHGIAGSVTDPTPLRGQAFLPGSNGFRRFHGDQFHGRSPVVAVPYYVPYYGAYVYDSSYYTAHPV